MSPKAVPTIIITITAIFVLGCIWLVVRESREGEVAVRELKRQGELNRQALATALGTARAKVRESLRKQDAAAAADGGKEEVKTRAERSKKLRTAVRRKFFRDGNGVQLSADYKKACEMPKGDPTEEDQEIIDLAAESASEADLDTAAEITDAALKSKDPRARIAAVEMLSALGEVGLVDIGEFLADEHPEVANLAADRWELGVQDILDEAERTALVKVGLLAITDKDQLRSMIGTLEMATDEKLIMDTVIEVVRDGTEPQREAVKVAYENLTGERWKDEKTAEKWLAENYTPPEPEEVPEQEEPSEDEE